MSAGLRRDSQLLDALGGIALGAAGIVDVCVTDQRQGPLWANVVAMVVFGVLMWWRRLTPRIGTYGFIALLFALAALLTPPPDLAIVFLGLLFFPYSAASRLNGYWSYAYVPVLFVAVSAANLSAEHSTFGDYVFPTALALAAYAAGRNVVHRTALAAEMHEAALRAAEERESEARRAVVAERRRIAREMHDVVAHSISVMVVQAGGARRILGRDPERAQEAAAQIERTGRETLLEMRRLLGVMRGAEDAASRAPSPTLEDLPGLVRRARSAGLPIALRVQGNRRPVGAGLELAAYRVVEDALEDVLRVAPGVPTEVSVQWTPEALEVGVVDERPGVPLAAGAGPDLVGVRERVSVYGGELRTGQRPGGGHEVHVRFPIDDPPGTQPPDSNHVPAQGAA